VLLPTFSAAAWNPIFECMPWQNGFLLDAPHRHNENGDYGNSIFWSS
jgi:hypothetical protein